MLLILELYKHFLPAFEPCLTDVGLDREIDREIEMTAEETEIDVGLDPEIEIAMGDHRIEIAIETIEIIEEEVLYS